MLAAATLSSWREARRRVLSRLQLFWLVHLASQPHELNGHSVMVIAPHQDDEVLGCGGLIALKRQAGIPVQIVFVTDGSASHAPASFPGEALATLRREEALEAAATLGVDQAEVHFLGCPDGGLRSQNAQSRQATVHALADLLRRWRPGELYVPHRHDRTEDHEATYELAMAALDESGHAADVYQYAVWMLWSSLVFRDFPRAELAGARRLRIHAVRARKRLALQAHRSQWTSRGGAEGPVLEPAFVRRFCLPNEVYFHTPVNRSSAADAPPGA